MRNSRRKILLTSLAVALFFTFAVVGCKSKYLERPFGYLRLGPLKNFLAAETVLDGEALIIRHDSQGLSAMSTLCTFDLTPLKIQTLPSGERVLASDYTASTYTLNGMVKTGPTVHNLPYFKLTADSLQVQGPRDTLYVSIGTEVNQEWRLSLSN